MLNEVFFENTKYFIIVLLVFWRSKFLYEFKFNNYISNFRYLYYLKNIYLISNKN